MLSSVDMGCLIKESRLDSADLIDWKLILELAFSDESHLTQAFLLEALQNRTTIRELSYEPCFAIQTLHVLHHLPKQVSIVLLVNVWIGADPALIRTPVALF